MASPHGRIHISSSISIYRLLTVGISWQLLKHLFALNSWKENDVSSHWAWPMHLMEWNIIVKCWAQHGFPNKSDQIINSQISQIKLKSLIHLHFSQALEHKYSLFCISLIIHHILLINFFLFLYILHIVWCTELKDRIWRILTNDTPVWPLFN